MGLACIKGHESKLIKEDAKITESTSKGKSGKKGEAQKNEYISEYKLNETKCIEGIAASDQEMFEFVQNNLDKSDLECVVLISPNVSNAYRLPDEEATETGVSMAAQLILSNAQTLKIFHLNGQRLDRTRAPALVKSLMECKNLILVDFHDCMIDNDGARFIYNNLKDLPNIKEINLSTNDINAETRNEIQDGLENYSNLDFIF
mmetsp:Transcript_22599/g.27861  ORF Transcript_22599/g.27861 Transcript_22599/m.27861 type:complete len:204 (-) Transcript_22599:47-658(-)